MSNSVALDGGGQCEWKLNNIKFDFQFHDMKKYGESVNKNIPNDIVFLMKTPFLKVMTTIIMFLAPLKLKKDYYPLIRNKITGEDLLVLSVQGQAMRCLHIVSMTQVAF